MSSLKILLVEDAPDMQLLVKSLIGRKYVLKCVPSAEEASAELERGDYSMMILDVSLPGEDGFKLCANLRSESKFRDLPIVFLSGKTESRDKVLAFSLGADDYMVKPIDIPEFQARIDAKMRRIQERSDFQNTFNRGPFRVSLNEQKIFAHESDLDLSTIEFKLFYYLLRHEDHVLERSQILNEVWGLNTHVTDRSVDTYIYSLRKKLGNYASCVRSVPRIGYRLCLSETNKAA